MKLFLTTLLVYYAIANLQTVRHQKSVTIITTLYKTSLSHYPEGQKAKKLEQYLKNFAKVFQTESKVVIFGQPQFLSFFRKNTVGKTNFVFISRSISQYRQIWFQKYLRQLFKTEISQSQIDKKLLSYSKLSLVAEYCQKINYFDSEYIAFLDGDMKIKNFAYSGGTTFRPKIILEYIARMFPSQLMIPRLEINEEQRYFDDFFIAETSSIKSTVSLFNTILLNFLERKVLPKQVDLMKQMSEKYQFLVSIITLDSKYPQTIDSLSQFSRPHQPSLQYQFNRDGTLIRRIYHEKDFTKLTQPYFQMVIKENLQKLIQLNIALLSLYFCWFAIKKSVKFIRRKILK